jgi:acyl dehydratase
MPLRTTTIGLDSVRFPAPFPVGAQVSAQTSVVDISRSESGLVLTTRHRYSLEGASKPVSAAELVSFVLADNENPIDASPPGLAGGSCGAVAIRDLPNGTSVAPSLRHDSAFYERLADRSGQWLGTTAWTCISDREAHAFALLTGNDGSDSHDDLPSRAHPFQGRDVPPLQLLALRAYFSPQVGLPVLTDDSMMAFNYGVDSARWHAAVRTGTRLRDHVQLLAAERRRPGDHLVTTRHVLEAEGIDHAVMVADCKTLYRTSS